jgi:hypothetical protein
MNTSFFREGRYFLFEGGALRGSVHHAWLLEQPQTQRIFADLDEEAAAVGPLLLPASSAAEALVQRLRAEPGPQRFACSQLDCQAPVLMLVEHLQQVRYLFAGTTNRQRYLFRYVDGRAFNAVWQALDSYQRDCLLGPITAWESLDHTRPVCRTGQGVAPELFVELLLQPAQWHQVLEADRIGGLHEAAKRLADELDVGQPIADYGLTTEAYCWLRGRRITDTSVQVVVTAAAWRLGLAVFEARGFEAAVEAAQSLGDTTALLVCVQQATGMSA